MFQRYVYGFVAVSILAVFFSCKNAKEDLFPKDTLFTALPASVTGINFINEVVDTKEINIFNYHNFYNGGGVAIGDVNNDGKPDIFFTSNQQKNKLYINKGNWKFEDVTYKAGLSSNHKWHTGVNMVDINADGWLDIYVCNSGVVAGDDKANELYINQQNGTFKEEAKLYGLDDKGESTQAIFFDYDGDRDLDCFVLNDSHQSIENFGYSGKIRNVRDPINGDRLYRNDAGKFTDVSASAGIYGSTIGFGLGIAAGDLNNDGWTDLYVSNDFFERDYMYINQHNGTFREISNEAIGHMSNGSMGSDMADINNDGYLDIFTAEMLPEDDYRLKTTLKFDEYDIQNAKNRMDFHYQFTTNCLQLNNQDGTFSEIAQLAGVDATGWSWSALSFDFDNDGWKDIYVCNGLNKDLTDQDFLEFFGSQKVLNQLKEGQYGYMDILNKMPAVPLKNYAFVNQKNLFFKNQSDSLGFDAKAFSNGAAYADLDEDGDLDLVVNNVNSEAFIYRNQATEKTGNHYLKIKLDGLSPNTFGYGTRVTLYANGLKQLLEQMPCRGFQSSVSPVLTFGLGSNASIDSVLVQWPGGKQQVIKNPHADTSLVLHEREAMMVPMKPVKQMEAMYSNITAKGITGSIQHRENEFVDFDVERLIPKMLSTQGPKIAVADINGDGLDDMFVGSAFADTAKIFIQRQDGTLAQKPQAIFNQQKYFENTGVEFFDADGDSDFDLVVAAGGNQANIGSPYLLTRLYMNDGKGNFLIGDTSKWPPIKINASCVRAGDYNGDGKKDLFIGARSIPGSYGIPPSSILLQNNGYGVFVDVSAAIAPQLNKLGMVTDAQWVDIDKDGTNELIITGDWMPVTIFKFSNGKLNKYKEIANSSGWWNCLTIADLNGDGNIDFAAGNNGLNARIKADVSHPAKLYINDFDKNGQTECIPVYYKSDGKAYPYFLKGEMEMQIPVLKKKFLRFTEFAGKTIEEIFTREQIESARILSVTETRSAAFINNGKGEFQIQPFPVAAQLSPVFGILATDLNNDGLTDLFMGGNFYGLKPQSGRYDASYGTTLLGTGIKGFQYMPPKETGLFVKGEVRDIKRIKAQGKPGSIVVAMNNEPLYLFRKGKQ
jgi:enediyne biosynthesis protein E4